MSAKERPIQKGRRHPGVNEGLATPPKAGARAQILAAAAELAKETGAAHISIDAIARRAGVSKGGLLYHFPKKNDLIQALVEHHLSDIEAQISEIAVHARDRRSNAVARTLLEFYREKVCSHRAAPDGVLLALAENPHLLDPARAFEKRLVERIRDSAADPELSLIAVLMAEGMKALDLFESNPLTESERTAVLDRMLSMLDREP